jgi:acyl-CoA oxidase
MREVLDVLAALKRPRREMASVVLPQATRIIESIGHRMAIEAAYQTGIDTKLIKLYEISAVKCDPAWYAEHCVGRIEQDRMERDAVEAAAPELGRFVEELNIYAYIQAPIVSDHKWEAYAARLPSFDGEDSTASGIRGSEGWVVARL